MNWSKIKWNNYIAFLSEKDNLNRFPLLVGMSRKEWVKNDRLALDLLNLEGDNSFQNGDVIKKIEVNGKVYKSRKSISFAYGLVAVDHINRFIDNEDYIHEKLFVHLTAIHFAKDFDEEEINDLTEHFNNMSVAEFWPTGFFFFLKYEGLMRSKMILENNAIASEQK